MKYAIAIALLLATTAANAACTQADLAGAWQIYSAGWDGADSWWSRCKMTLNATGTMSNASCTDSAGQTGPMTAGSASIIAGPTCTYTAQFRIGGALNKVVHATMAKDKTTGSGVGTFPGGKFIFTMSKL
jgi:hypothetical protein